MIALEIGGPIWAPEGYRLEVGVAMVPDARREFFSPFSENIGVLIDIIRRHSPRTLLKTVWDMADIPSDKMAEETHRELAKLAVMSEAQELWVYGALFGLAALLEKHGVGQIVILSLEYTSPKGVRHYVEVKD